MTRIAHISDLHFGRAREPVVAGLLESLTEQRPERVVISGDLTQRARRREYAAAAEFIRRLRRPCLAVPGNHDLAAFNLLERFLFPWRRWRRVIDRTLQPTVNTPELLLGVNTARPWSSPVDFSRGRISSQQVNEVLQRAEAAEQQTLRVLVAHHPFWLPAEYRHRGLIGGREAAIKAFAGGPIDLILSGHVHLPFRQTEQGMIISHAGTSCSDRLLPGQPNSYKLICGNRSRLKISLFRWDGHAFRHTNDEVFSRQKRGWVRTPSDEGQ